MWTVVCLVVVPGILASQLSDEENAQFPRLFHLDDYERCLSSPGGFYCLGSFRLGPSQPDNRVYQAMEEYSKDQLHFNRTLLHRGYCVSSRCPNPIQEAPLNQSEWFADCVAQWARTKGFTTTPLTIEYCNSKEQANAVELDAPKIAFAVVVFCILFCNVIGSTYDVLTPDDVKKNKYLGCWSWTQNWRRLTAPCDQSDPRRAALLPAHGVRVITLLLVMLMHCGLIHYKLYSYNPHYLEKMMLDPVFMMSRNGTPLVCLFLLLSSFLLAHSLLQLARSRPLTCSLLPTCLLQRIARISPTYLLVVGFSATWWAEVGGGPLWAGSVRAEGDVCRRKFWAHTLFVNNLVQPHEHCLIQTWFLAVDMQLYIVCCVLTIALARAGTGKWTLLFLTALFLATCLLNGALAYAFEWRSMLFIMNPESLRSLYRDVPSFSRLYTAPWGALPASVLGVLLAYLHAHLQATGFNFTKHRFLTWVYRYSTHLMVALAATGIWLQRLSSAPALAVHAAVDRPLLCLLGSILLLGLFQGVDGRDCSTYLPVMPAQAAYALVCVIAALLIGIARRVFSWHCWAVLSRLSLAALLLHWSVALTALAASPQPPLAGYYTIIWEWLATATVTYLLSVPLTLLVELPAQRTITALLT